MEENNMTRDINNTLIFPNRKDLSTGSFFEDILRSPRTLGFEHLYNNMNLLHGEIAQNNTFPPFNVYKKNNQTLIEIALAGYSKDDITVDLDRSKNRLVVSGETSTRPVEQQTNEDDNEDRWTLVSGGLAKRKFYKSFIVRDTVQVESCRFEDGVLKIIVTEPQAESSTKIKIE